MDEEKKKEILMGKVIKISRVSLHSNSDHYLRDETYRATTKKVVFKLLVGLLLVLVLVIVAEFTPCCEVP